jgi:hypothetical protein
VPKAFGDLLRVNALSDQQGRVRVAKIVEADLGKAVILADVLKTMQGVPTIQRCSGSGREDILLLGPIVTSRRA